ncbi:MAG TPA: hypothetical protein VGP76_27550 [Planctomycetaceae bacterium]|jgi:hypothetical protein|nr:hypothetical protein [Planctomycetaceae bacterium]
MKINDDHMYHGAALTQIAEHRRFTAINAFKDGDEISRSAFRVNDDIGVFLKYATKPAPAHDEYVFQFTPEHLNELERIAALVPLAYLALVCVKGREICCLDHKQLKKMIAQRRRAKGEDEDQYTVLVKMPFRKEFRVYVNAPGRKNTMLGAPILVPRNAFPESLFA